MAKITNPSGRAITLGTGHVVPANGMLETTNDILRCTDNAPMLNGLAVSGQIGVTYDAETDLDGIKAKAFSIEPSAEALAQAEVDRQLAIAAEENRAAMEAAAIADAEPAPKKK